VQLQRTTDASTRELLNKLADEERKHTQTAGNLEEKHLTQTAKAQRTSRTGSYLAAGRAARVSGVDGRLGFHAGAAVCGGLRDAQELGRILVGAGGVHPRGHLDGICGVAVG